MGSIRAFPFSHEGSVLAAAPSPTILLIPVVRRPATQAHLNYNHGITVGLCFLVARVMTPWQRTMLFLDR